MPGGRLTQQDRRLIASGLAEGLGYAEIARRLDRPTSTISREVGRNGGSDGYRAEYAHHATEHRARRSKPAVPPEVPAELDAYGRNTEAVRDFTEQFAAMMVATGVPRMASRVLACLYTTDSRSLTAADLVQRLRVSPASVSKAIGYLESLEMVQRDRDPGRRHEHYTIEDDVWLQAWTTSARKNLTWAEVARTGATLLDPSTPAGARLDRMSQFFARLGEDMSGGPTMEFAEDAMTVFAALVHVRTPLTVHQLATALEWTTDRVTNAVATAEKYAGVTDPVTIAAVAPDTYTVQPAPTRLTQTQRKALELTATDR